MCGAVLGRCRTEMRMLQWILGASRRDMIRNKKIWRCGVADIVDKMRGIFEIVWACAKKRRK